MELKWLEDFLSLAETRSFSRSAELRYVTQSTFSRRIKALELWIGVPLVDRSSYPTTLTPAGAAFRDTAEEALRVLYEMRDELRGKQRTNRDAVTFYALHALTVTFFPKWLSACVARVGRFDSRLVPDNPHNCVRALFEGSADFVLSYAHPSIPLLLDPGRYPSVHLASERFFAVSAPDARGEPRYRLPGSRRAPLPYLAYSPNTFLGQAVEFIVGQQTEPPHLRCCFENPMADALKAMAVEGHGIAWMPENLIAEELQQGLLVPAGDAGFATGLDVRLYRALGGERSIVDTIWSSLG